MPSHARTVTRKTHRVRNALLVVLLLLVVCAAAAGFSGFKLYKSAMSGVPVPRPNRRARRFPLPITTSSIRSGTFLRSRSPRTCTTPAVPVLHPVRGHPSQPR